MHPFRTALAPLLLLAARAVDAVVFRDQVGQIDFHHELVGLPQPHTTFFHRPRRDDKARLLYTLSDAGVLGAVNPSTGALLWRHLLDEDDGHQDDETPSTGHLQAVDGEGWLAAGLGRSVHAWNSVSGRNVWWADFAGEVADVAVVVEATAGEAAVKADAAARRDVLALFHEAAGSAKDELVLRRLRGNDGHVVWEHREAVHHSSSATAGQALSLQVAAAAGKAYVVSFVPGSGLKVLTLDAQTGHRIEEHTLGSDLHAAEDVLFVGGGIVVWTDGSRSKAKINLLGTKAKHEVALPDGTAEVLVHALRQPSSSSSSATTPLHFVVHTRTAHGAAHRAQVYHVDAKKGTVQKAYDLPQAPGAGAFALTEGANSGAAFFITRITDDEIVLTDSASHGILGRWPVAQPAPVHTSGTAVAEVVAKPGGDGYAVRAAVLTADEDWVLVRNGQRAWARPEGLTGGVAAALADRPESEQLVRALEEEENAQSPLAAYLHRVRRHVADLERLPAYLQSVPGRLLSSIVGSTDSTSPTTPAGGAPDAFGFHKLAILATRRGRLYGLDAASPGTIQWTAKAVDVGAGGSWAVKHIHVDEASGVATVVGARAGQSVTVKIETGETTASAVGDDAGEVASAVLVDSAAGPWLLAVPKDGAIPAIPLARCPTESLVVRSSESGGSSAGIQGVRFVENAGQCVQETTWTFAPPPRFRVVDVATRPAHDPVASIGRVLGDRRVLYKYLNPNLAVVAAVDDEAAVLLTFLLDTVSGQVLASATYGGVDGAKPVSCLLFENTFVCTYFADYSIEGEGAGSEPQTIKGYHLTVSDLYESDEPNSRGVLGSAGDAGAGNVSAVEPLDVVVDGGQSAAVLLPAVSSRTWVVASRLASLAVSQTRQGVTVREVLAYVPRAHGIVGLPRVGGVLDARRPVGRDATPAEAEEGLMRYAANLELDPRLVVTHERDVLGVRHIVTAATHVESTSLVLAFGAVDVFGTRVAPSLVFDLLDKGFGKLSMLGTVAALAVGVAVLRPMVTKKQINLRWKAPL